MGKATVVFESIKSAEAFKIIRPDLDLPMGPGVAGCMVDLAWMPEYGQAWALYEGDHLPPCEPNQKPIHFESLDAMINHVDDIFHQRLAFARRY